jgi:HEAT repeat protein
LYVKQAVEAMADRIAVEKSLDLDTDGVARIIKKLDANAGFARLEEKLPSLDDEQQGSVLFDLCRIDAPRTVPLLIEAIRRVAEADPENHRPECPSEADSHLACLNDTTALRPVLDAIDHPLPAVRAASAGALGSIGGAEAIEALTKLAERDPHEGVREDARKALERGKKAGSP